MKIFKREYMSLSLEEKAVAGVLSNMQIKKQTGFDPDYYRPRREKMYNTMLHKVVFADRLRDKQMDLATGTIHNVWENFKPSPPS